MIIVPQLPWVIFTLIAAVFVNADEYNHPWMHNLGYVMLFLAFIYFILYWGSYVYFQMKDDKK
jgi:hypothetical protein